MVRITATILLLSAICLGRAEHLQYLSKAVRLDRDTQIEIMDWGRRRTNILFSGTRLVVLSGVRERAHETEWTRQKVRVLDGVEGGSVGDILVDWELHQQSNHSKISEKNIVNSFQILFTLLFRN
jgi:hypothetical protein